MRYSDGMTITQLANKYNAKITRSGGEIEAELQDLDTVWASTETNSVFVQLCEYDTVREAEQALKDDMDGGTFIQPGYTHGK